MSDNLHILRRRKSPVSTSPDPDPTQQKFPVPTLARALPWLLLGAFGVLAWLLFGDRFERARPVELVKVVTARASAATSVEPAGADDSLSFTGGTLFQSSGWIEADPLPIRATTLYSGVVKEVHVLQGEAVAAGQVLATMVDDDARLDLQSARANLAQARADLEQGNAAVSATEAALNTLAREVAAAAARRAELVDQYQRLEKAGNEVFRESEITQSQLRVATQARAVEALQARQAELQARRRSDQAAVQAAAARVESAAVDVARRQLALDRTQVRSPVSGRVQELYAAPGMKRMLNMDGPDTATIAKIFQPDSLQARIDVPLEEAAQLRIGQPVRLRTTLLPNQTFQGEVTRLDGQADLQRNTLQAKVRLLDPGPLLRPEMLCRAEFLAQGQEGGAAAGSTASGSARVAIYVPQAALLGSGRERTLWALDASGQRVEQRSVVVDLQPRDTHLQVIEGLRPGDFVVQNPPADLASGARVKDIERRLF